MINRSAFFFNIGVIILYSLILTTTIGILGFYITLGLVLIQYSISIS